MNEQNFIEWLDVKRARRGGPERRFNQFTVTCKANNDIEFSPKFVDILGGKTRIVFGKLGNKFVFKLSDSEGFQLRFATHEKTGSDKRFPKISSKELAMSLLKSVGMLEERRAILEFSELSNGIYLIEKSN